MATSDLRLEAQIRKLWEWDFFVTAHFSCFFFWKIGSTSAGRNSALKTPPGPGHSLTVSQLNVEFIVMARIRIREGP